jgi:hypothetical protein
VHARNLLGDFRVYLLFLNSLEPYPRPRIMDPANQRNHLSAGAHRRPSVLRSVDLLPNRFHRPRPHPLVKIALANGDPIRYAGYGVITTLGVLVGGLSQPSMATPLLPPAQVLASWAPQLTLIGAITVSLLFWWKRSWLTAWMRWFRGLLSDLGAALGTRHHVIHDRRYLEDIIKAELESGSDPLMPGQDSRPASRRVDPIRPLPSSRSRLRQGSRRGR